MCLSSLSEEYQDSISQNDNNEKTNTVPLIEQSDNVKRKEEEEAAFEQLWFFFHTILPLNTNMYYIKHYT